MPHVGSADADFHACELSFAELKDLQRDAERHRFSTRWSSVSALEHQVQDGPVFLVTLLREMRGETVRAYRCLLRIDSADPHVGTVMTTLDLTPARHAELPRANADCGQLRLEMAGLPGMTKA